MLVCLDSLSTPTFIDPDKYSKSNRDRFKRYCQISLLIGVKSWFLVPSTFIKYDRTLMLSMQMWTVIASFPFNVKDIAVYLGALSFKTCETFVPPGTMAPLLSGLDNSHPSLVMMHLGLLLTEVGEKLKISCCRESNLLSTITILSLPPSKLSLSPRKSCDNLFMLNMIFVEGCWKSCYCCGW